MTSPHNPDYHLLTPALADELVETIARSEDPLGLIEELRDLLYSLSPLAAMPVDRVRWVPIDMVQANDYNPNSVAMVEMGLLKVSIDSDGYTQPVVTVWDPVLRKYVIVDGFHRFYVMQTSEELRKKTGSRLPIVVINKSINDRMASTVRHNRARGKHSIQGMSALVFNMLDNGWADDEICNELGMELEELVRLKHITGFSKLFADTEYKRAWKTKRQILLESQYREQGETVV